LLLEVVVEFIWNVITWPFQKVYEYVNRNFYL
jgi:hypothetical protein